MSNKSSAPSIPWTSLNSTDPIDFTRWTLGQNFFGCKVSECPCGQKGALLDNHQSKEQIVMHEGQLAQDKTGAFIRVIRGCTHRLKTVKPLEAKGFVVAA